MHDEEMRMTIGRMIEQARKERGWSYYELAKRTGMGVTHLKSIEQGAYSCRVDIFNKICEALGIEVIFPIRK